MRMRGVAFPVLALALLVASASQATPHFVTRDDSVRALHAERHEMGARLDVVATALERASASQPAIGTADAPAEISEGNTPAGTSVGRGRWTYSVTVRERAAGDVPTGAFAVDLTWNARPVGRVHLQQALANPAAQEGARVTFDLGVSAPPDAALFVVAVRALDAPEAAYTLTSALRPDLQYVWNGDGGAENPTLAARVDSAVQITIVNGEGTAPHNLEILRDGAVVAKTEGEVTARDEQETLRWTPAAPGSYDYRCEFHPGSMAGTIEVAP